MTTPNSAQNKEKKSNPSGASAKGASNVSKGYELKEANRKLSELSKSVLPALLEEVGISTSKFTMLAYKTMKSDQKLARAIVESPDDFVNCILFCASGGLSPDSLAGEFYMIPFWNKEERRFRISPVVGYRGLVKNMIRGGSVLTVNAQVVFQGDEFQENLGSAPELKHEPKHLHNSSAKITKAYAVAQIENGSPVWETMSIEQIKAVHRAAPRPNQLFLNDLKDPFHWMVKKIPLKQLSKKIPRNESFARIVELDNHAEGGHEIVFDEETGTMTVGEKVIGDPRTGRLSQGLSAPVPTRDDPEPEKVPENKDEGQKKGNKNLFSDEEK